MSTQSKATTDHKEVIVNHIRKYIKVNNNSNSQSTTRSATKTANNLEEHKEGEGTETII